MRLCVNVVQRWAAVALYALMKAKWRGFGGMLGKKHPNGQELMEAWIKSRVCLCSGEREGARERERKDARWVVVSLDLNLE